MPTLIDAPETAMAALVDTPRKQQQQQQQQQSEVWQKVWRMRDNDSPVVPNQSLPMRELDPLLPPTEPFPPTPLAPIRRDVSELPEHHIANAATVRIGEELLHAPRVVASCGLLNFEESAYSDRSSTTTKDHFGRGRVKPGCLAEPKLLGKVIGSLVA